MTKERVLREAENKEKRIFGEIERIKKELGGLDTKEKAAKFKKAMEGLLAREFPEAQILSGPNIFEELKLLHKQGALTDEELKAYTEYYLNHLPQNPEEPIQ